MTTFLDKAYGPRDTDQTRQLYDDWSSTYEAEVAENGYATPARCAEALARHMADKALPVLDFGCGTGLSGLALRSHGFTQIDGADLSADMLAQAREKGAYRDLWQVDPEADFPVRQGQYAAVAAIGVIGAGAAPISVFEQLVDVLAAGGLFVWSFNDHALEDPVNDGALRAAIEAGRVRLLFQEYGTHLPGIGIKSNVYVIEKL